MGAVYVLYGLINIEHTMEEAETRESLLFLGSVEASQKMPPEQWHHKSNTGSQKVKAQRSGPQNLKKKMGEGPKPTFST